MSFHGFISYSHAADGRLAPALQQGLHRLAKPWHRRRALWIFRDQTGLAVTPAMWSSIQHALDRSDYFVLLASPGAAASPWVNREIEHWIATRSADRILPVVTDGEWAWDHTRQDFTDDSTAVPPALRGAFDEVPLMLDLRWTHDEQRLSLQNPRFRDAIAQLAAPMHGVSKDELEGEDVRQHRRVRRLRTVAVSALLFFAFAAAVAGMFAARNAHLADVAGDETRRQQRIATEQRADAQSAAREAQAQRKNANTQRERAQSAASETRRQRQLARTQQVVAGRASAEAARQQRHAARQQQLAARAAAAARRQQDLARQAAARAQRQLQIADQQKKIAAKAARDAARQKQEAQRQQRLAVGRRLISQAHGEIGEEPQKALMLGLAAGKFLPDTEARRELISLMTSTNYVKALNGVGTAVYSPDGTTVATIDSEVGGAPTVSLRDRRTGEKLSDVTHATDRRAGPTDLAFSPDGLTLGVASGSDGVVLWDVTNPRRPARLPAASDDTLVSRASFSPDGQIIAASGEGFVHFWGIKNSAAPRKVSKIPGESLTFSADRRTAVTSEPVSLWDISNLSEPVLLATPDVASNVLALSPAGKLLATGSENGKIDLWDLTHPSRPERRVGVTGLTDPTTSLAFSPDGAFLAAGTQRGTAAIWSIADPSGPQLLRRMKNYSTLSSMAFSHDSRTLTINGDHKAFAAVWSVSEMAGSPRVGGTVEHRSQVVSATHSQDGQSLVTADVGGTAIFWDLANPGRPVARATLQSHTDPVSAVTVSRDMKKLAAAGSGGEVRLWDVSNPIAPKRLGTISTRNDGRRNILAFSPDGQTLASDSNTGLALWDLSNILDPKRVPVPTEFSAGTVMAFSPDGHSATVAGNAPHPNAPETVDVWQLRTGLSPTRRLQLPTPEGTGGISLAYSPDGRFLAAGNTGRTAELWDLAEPARPRMVATLAGHNDDVTSLAFSPDGRTVATGGPDRKVRLWDITQPTRPVRIATRHQSDLEPGTLAFNRDGTTLTAGGGLAGSGASVTLWGVGELRDMRADPATTACDAAGRGLTASEWTAYIPELDFLQTCHAPPTAITE